MNKTWLKRTSVPIAILLPWLITPLAILIANFMPKANLSLLYLLSVIFIAITFTVRLTLINAISSFFVFNYFFTEPYGSLLITHREDLFTVLFFLIVAFIVGHLAARLKENVNKIELREQMANIEMDMLEQLSKAVDIDQALKALQNALDACVIQYVLLDKASDVSSEQLPDYFQTDHFQTGTRQKLDEFFTLPITKNNLETMAISLQQKSGTEVLFIHDGRNLVALLFVIEKNHSFISLDFLTLLVRQVNTAIERTRLVADVALERIAKENELLRSALLSSVSHDFRTPLTSMIGSTSTLLSMGEQLDKAQTKELLTTVLEEAQRLNRYTQNLLDMTRLGFGELRLERHWISAEEIISAVSRRIKTLLVQHTLEIVVAPELPHLYVHAALIEQAIFNLLDNAIKFSPAQSTIYLHADSAENYLLFTVSDCGPGIPDSDKEHVFERFHTATQGDRRKSGSGLGLTICRGMIAAHGGTVSIHDNPNCNGTNQRGCRVQIKIPVNQHHE